MDKERSREIANEILNQLGGMRNIILMTGAKQFCIVNNGVSFKMGRKIVKVTLNALDYYDVQFSHLYNMEQHVDKLTHNIDCEQLMGHIEENTGYYLTLHKRKTMG